MITDTEDYFDVHGRDEEPRPDWWRCENCGEYFNKETFSHPVHAYYCDGTCLSCPVECGPVNKIGADT